jgi:hypothetical protein
MRYARPLTRRGSLNRQSAWAGRGGDRPLLASHIESLQVLQKTDDLARIQLKLGADRRRDLKGRIRARFVLRAVALPQRDSSLAESFAGVFDRDAHFCVSYFVWLPAYRGTRPLGDHSAGKD